jgi:hypothetical protein
MTVPIAAQPMSPSGHERRFERLPITSDLPRPTDIDASARQVHFVPILLQKSKVASLRIFGETLKREPVDDSDNLNRASEVDYEFCVRR